MSVSALRSQPRFFLGNPRAAGAGVERPPDILRRDTRRSPEHEQVIEEVGALGNDALSIAARSFDHRLDRLLAELLRDLDAALCKELRRVRRCSIAALAAGDEAIEPVERRAVDLGH